MTFTDAINAAAQHAAESVLDAFGYEPAGGFPSADLAWEQIQDFYAEGTLERPAGVPDDMPGSFRELYKQQLRALTGNHSMQAHLL